MLSLAPREGKRNSLNDAVKVIGIALFGGPVLPSVL